jgi:hypothetical protein
MKQGSVAAVAGNRAFFYVVSALDPSERLFVCSFFRLSGEAKFSMRTSALAGKHEAGAKVLYGASAGA